ncbi:MAG: hypothetical protein H6745_19215 [Deltaproteobacteria bacterium]|nr:hypothetical protein [Deltaproteobacteria bacterium]
MNAWEEWGRQVAGIVVAGLLILAWYLGWIPDVVTGLVLLLGAIVAGVAVVGLRTRALALSAQGRNLGYAALVGGVVLALLAPWSLMGPGSDKGSGETSESGQVLTFAPQGSGPGSYELYVHGQPSLNHNEVALKLALTEAATGKTYHRRATFEAHTQGRGRRATSIKRYDDAWPVVADLSKGATLTMIPDNNAAIAWPVHYELHGAPLSPAWYLVPMVAVLALALVAERKTRRRERTGLTIFVATAGVFGVLFGIWYAPGRLTTTVFGAALVATVGGALIAYPALALARKGVPKEPEAADAGARGLHAGRAS